MASRSPHPARLHLTRTLDHFKDAFTELDLPFVALPVPVAKEDRDVMHERTGTRTIPAVILEDGTVLSGDATEIVAELDGRFPEPETAEAHKQALAQATKDEGEHRYLVGRGCSLVACHPERNEGPYHV